MIVKIQSHSNKMFQFLIGRFATLHVREICTVIPRFQFLIGRFATIYHDALDMDFAAFQFLIGRFATRREAVLDSAFFCKASQNLAE